MPQGAVGYRFIDAALPQKSVLLLISCRCSTRNLTMLISILTFEAKHIDAGWLGVSKLGRLHGVFSRKAERQEDLGTRD
jgi:hypothetical protein